MQTHRFILSAFLPCIVSFQMLSLSLAAQEISQTIRGTVTDDATQRPLPGVSVYLSDTRPTVGTVTDDEGHFQLERVPVGRYALIASSVGYETFTIPDLLVRSGKETVLTISLVQSVQNLSEVVVTEEPARIQTVSPLGSHSFSV